MDRLRVVEATTFARPIPAAPLRARRSRSDIDPHEGAAAIAAIDSLVYASKTDIDLRELTSLVRWSRERNENLGLSGLLLYDSFHFLGYLEGAAVPLQRLYDAIAADPRHEQVRLLERAVLGQRRFDRWYMGYLYEPKFIGELEALWSGAAPLGDLAARLRRWRVEGDVL